VPKSRVLLLCALGTVCALGLTSCSGKSAITITLSPSSTVTINQGQTQAITATLTNDTKNQGVTWTVSGVGTLSDQTTTGVTYVSPASLTADTTVTITATSVATTSITATLTITVDAVFGFTTTSLPAATLNLPYSGVITATGSTGPFTWAVTTGTLPAGLTLSNSDTASILVSGTPTVLGTSAFTIQVTDSAGVAISESLSITVNVPPPLSVATKSLPNGTVGTAYQGAGYTLQASSGVPPYTWSITSGSLPPGFNTLSSAGLISGTPTTAGTSQFTVQITDSSTPNKQMASASLSLTVNASTANDAELMGNYAFLVSGFDVSGRFMAAGSFFANGFGQLTSGTMDSNDPANVVTALNFTGTYLIDSSNLGTMTFAGRTFAFTLAPNGTSGKIVEFDTTGAQASGVLLQQAASPFSTSQIVNNYAFGFLGADAQGDRYGFAGELAADGAGNFTSGAIDSDDNGTVVPNSGATGTYSVPSGSTNGRGTATITFSAVETNYSFYIVSSTQLLFMEIDHTGLNPRVSGSMLQQATSPTLSGTSVFETTALNAAGPTALGQVGLLVTASGSLST